MAKLNVVLGTNKAELVIDEKVYELRPLTLGDIAIAEDKFGCELDEWEKALKKLRNILFLIFLSIKKTSQISFEDVGNLFQAGDVEKMTEVVKAIMSISGLVQKNEDGTPGIQG